MPNATSTLRAALRARLAAQVTAATVYISANATAFFAADQWQSPSLVLELQESPIDPENRLIGFGEQERELLFNVYIAVRGSNVATQGTATLADDFGTIEMHEEMSNGIFDLIDAVEDALMYFDVTYGMPAKVNGLGWEQHTTTPFTTVYITRWVVKHGVIQQA